MPDAFNEAQAKVKTLSQTPSNEQLLQLYALFKQGSVGDVSGKRPGMLDIKGRAKFDAWSKVKGTPQDEAQGKYVNLVETLASDLG